MRRCCPRTPLVGLTDKDIVTWQKETYPSLINEAIEIVSPQEGESYQIGVTISTTPENILTKNNIVVQKKVTVTEQYKLKKVLNGVVVVPTEYKDNGQIYQGTSATTSYTLNENVYDVNLLEI